jgi:hypothetical protein
MAYNTALNLNLDGLSSGIGSAMIVPGANGSPTPTPTPAPTPTATATPTPTPTPATPASSPMDIAARIAQITGKDSALMRQARTEGMKQANRRGIMNSSIGIGAAQSEALKVAAPIAGQEAQDRMQRDVQAQTLAAQREQAMAELASKERGNLADNFSTQMANYQQALSNTLNNENIPAATRAAVQQSLRDQLNYGLGWMQKLYGVTIPS